MNSQQLTVISKPHVGWAVPTIILTIVTLSGMLCLSGCEGFRYAATDAQKENAWLHGQVCGAAANAAVDENASQRLCDLTTLAHEQSTAFVADPPGIVPAAKPPAAPPSTSLKFAAEKPPPRFAVLPLGRGRVAGSLVAGQGGLFNEAGCV